MPYCVKGGVCVKHRVLCVRIGELVAVLVHTYEPAAELVSESFGGLNAVKLAVYRNDVSKCVSTLVAKVKVNGVFGSAVVLGNPACVYGRIRLNNGCRKIEGSFKS